MNYNNEAFIHQFKNIVNSVNPSKVLFVCSSEYDRYGYRNALDLLGVNAVAFTGFEPCPEVSSVMAGIELYNNESCDFIIAVGGGSAIDVAKGIKYYGELDTEILAVPTTAGTGAEVTRFAVLYRNADKESVRSYDIIPEYQVFDHTALLSLPNIQRVVTGLDAFCHSVEAFWSLDRTEESIEYSTKALKLFKDNYDAYLSGDESTNEPMMKCSELAGRAINIAQTCAPHAFSYKLHKLKGFYHGQAVAVCLAYIWKYLAENGDDEALQRLADTERISGFTNDEFISLLNSLGLMDDFTMSADEFEETVNGVNTSRLLNTPMAFTADDIRRIYSSFIIVK